MSIQLTDMDLAASVGTADPVSARSQLKVAIEGPGAFGSREEG